MKLRRGASLQRQDERSRRMEFSTLSRYAATALTGLAIGLGAPALAGAEEAASRPAASQPASRPSVARDQQLRDLMTALQGARGPNHPLDSTNAQELADTVIKLGEISGILRSRPAEGTSERAVYDAALQAFGGSGQSAEEALNEVHSNLAAAIRQLRNRATTSSDVGTHARELQTVLQSISSALLLFEDSSVVALSASEGDLSCLLRMLQSSATCGSAEAPEELRTPYGIPSKTLPVPRIRLQDFRLGSYQILTTSGDRMLRTLGAYSTPELDVMFDNRTNAQGAVDAMARAYATVWKYPNDDAKLRAAATNLKNALDRIPSTGPDRRRIWDSSDFQAAMRALENGDLRSGLGHLAGETQFNNIYGALNNFYVVSVNQRAVPLFRTSFTWSITNDDNIREFEEYLGGDRRVGFSMDIHSYNLSLMYDYFVMSGELSQLSLSHAADGLVSVERVGGMPLTGTGHALSARFSLRTGGSIFGHPTIIDWIFPTVGGRWWKLGANVQMQDGSYEEVSVGSKRYGDFYVGLWGLDFQFPGFNAERWPVRLERLAVGAVGMGLGDEPHPFPFMTGSVSVRLAETDQSRWRLLFSPEYFYVPYQHRLGGDVRAEAVWQVRQNLALQAGIGSGLFAVIRPEHKDANGLTVASDTSMVIDPYASITLRIGERLSLDGRAGYMVETGVDRALGEQLPGLHGPGSFYGSLNAVLHW